MVPVSAKPLYTEPDLGRCCAEEDDGAAAVLAGGRGRPTGRMRMSGCRGVPAHRSRKEVEAKASCSCRTSHTQRRALSSACLLSRGMPVGAHSASTDEAGIKSHPDTGTAARGSLRVCATDSPASPVVRCLMVAAMVPQCCESCFPLSVYSRGPPSIETEHASRHTNAKNKRKNERKKERMAYR